MNGKWAIHPGQAETIAEHFTPSQTQVDQARKQKTAFEEALQARPRGRRGGWSDGRPGIDQPT